MSPLLGRYVLKMYDSVPDRMPSILMISSPVSIRPRSVDSTGRPAPTVASYRNWRPVDSDSCCSAAYWARGPAAAAAAAAECQGEGDEEEIRGGGGEGRGREAARRKAGSSEWNDSATSS